MEQTTNELNQIANQLDREADKMALSPALIEALNRLTAAADRLSLTADRHARLLDRRLSQQAAQAADGLATITRHANGAVEVRVADPAASSAAAKAVVASATRPAGDDEWASY